MPRKRIYSLNESAFEEVTEQSAYWIGFLMADGSITTRKKTTPYLNLYLVEEDSDHIKKFITFLGSNQPIKTYNNSGLGNSNLTGISVSSAKLVFDLSAFGVIPRKSYLATTPPQLMANRDFWRGLIDGDGYIYQTFNKLPAIGLCGTEDIVVNFKNYVKGISPKCKSKPRKRKIWQFQTSGEPAQKIIEVLYTKNSVSLSRKNVLAQKFISHPFVSHKADCSHLTLEELIKMKKTMGDWKSVAGYLGINVRSIYRIIKRLKS